MRAIILTFVCSVLMISTVFSQSKTSLQNCIDEYYEAQPIQAINCLKDILKIYQSEKDWDNYTWTLAEIADNYQYAADWYNFKIYLDKALAAEKKHQINTQSEFYGFLWNLYGVYAYQQNDFSNAVEYFKSALAVDTLQEAIFEENLAISYQNIGSIYTELGDYQRAILHFKNGLRLFQQLNNKAYLGEIANTYNSIGDAYQYLQANQKALFYVKKAHKVLQSQNLIEDYPTIATNIYNNLAIYYQRKEQYDSTFFYLNKSRALPSLSPLDKATVLKHFGTTYYKKENYTQALNYLRQAHKLRNQHLPHKQAWLSLTYQAIGDVYQAQKKYTQALENYQLAISSVVYDFNDTKIESNPSLTNIVQPMELLKSLAAKAYTLQLSKKYKQALNTYELCDQLLHKMRHSYQNQTSKLFLIEESITIYERAIEVAMQLGKEEQAFRYAERSKSMLLLEATRGIEARFGLPQHLIDEEKQLKVSLDYYTKQIWEERQKTKNINKENISKWEQIVFDLNEEYAELQKALKQNYPEYYQAHYNDEVSSLSVVQKQLLNSKTAMITYFIGTQKDYVFVLSNKKLEIIPLEKTGNLTTWIDNMRLFLRRDINLKNAHQVYYQTAYQLYKHFLKPAIQRLPKSTERLILIPDDQLNFIPFEALLTQPVNFEEGRFEQDIMPYLIKDFQITYGYSATLLIEGLKKKNSNNLKTFGGFVPSFQGRTSYYRGCDEGILGNLRYGSENIQTINQIMDGTLHFGDGATIDKFKSKANQYKILHLCTHACASSSIEDTRIYFTDDELLAFELYNLPLNAQLAVLSACETGIGALKRGEGVMSLARGFMYSGCPSVVTSLWSVDDNSTSEIMRIFYENIKTGHDKDKALHLAKISYLEGNDVENSHPFFWASFVHIGNTQPLFNDDGFEWWWLIILLVIGLGVWFWRRR